MIKNKINNIKWSVGALLSLSLIIVQIFPLLISQVSAVSLTNTYVQFNNMTASAATTGTVCVKPATTNGAIKDWIVAYPTNFTVGAAGTWGTINTTSNSAWPTGAIAWPGATTATATVIGQAVTWTNSAGQNMVNTSVYCYNWTGGTALTQPASPANNEAGTITTQIAGPSTIDSGTYTTATVANDQINVTATVNPAFTVAFSANADPLGNLSQTSVSTSSASTIAVNTNGLNGWSAWVEGTNTGLYSPSQTYTIKSDQSPTVGSAAAILAAGTEGVNLGIAYSQGVGGTCVAGSAVTSAFSGAGKGGGFDDLAYSPIINCTGSSNTGLITPTNYASINGATPYASDYSDLETYIAAGNF